MNSNQLKAVTTLPRCTAGLSLLGSGYISYSVLKTRKQKGNWSVHDRLLLALSITDIITSFVFLLGDIPIPKEDGGKGNQMTCDIQGFFAQFVPATVMYNGSLALYYLLYITFDWKESQLRYMEYVIHPFILVFVISTGIACIYLEMFNPALFDCWIMDKPFLCTVDPNVDCIRGYNAQFYQWIFYYIPIYFIILFSSVAMFLVYRAVRRQDHQSFRWTMSYSEGSNNRKSRHRDAYQHSRRVAVQGMFYIGAFYLTWIIPLVTRLLELANADVTYPLLATTAFLLPIQGFFNFLVYIRPKVLNYYRTIRQENNGGTSTSNRLSSLFLKSRSAETKSHQSTASGGDAVGSRVVVECDDHQNQQCRENTAITDNGNGEGPRSPGDGKNHNSNITPRQQEQKDVACSKNENEDDSCHQEKGNRPSSDDFMIQNVKEHEEHHISGDGNG